MITKEQALTANNFTSTHRTNADGTPQRFRRNGKTKTWKRQPERFEIPVKYGLYGYGYITENNANQFNVAE